MKRWHWLGPLAFAVFCAAIVSEAPGRGAAFVSALAVIGVFSFFAYWFGFACGKDYQRASGQEERADG